MGGNNFKLKETLWKSHSNGSLFTFFISFAFVISYAYGDWFSWLHNDYRFFPIYILLFSFNCCFFPFIIIFLHICVWKCFSFAVFRSLFVQWHSPCTFPNGGYLHNNLQTASICINNDNNNYYSKYAFFRLLLFQRIYPVLFTIISFCIAN